MRRITRTLAKAGTHVAGLVWLAAGAIKLTDLEGFRELLANHGIVPDHLIHWVAVFVPVLEVLLGCSILLWGGHPVAQRGQRFAAALGVAWLMVLIVYLWRVPSERLNAFGCGCHGSGGPIRVLGTSARLWAVLADAALLCCHCGSWVSIQAIGQRE